MTSFRDHYDRLLADHYTWMSGGRDFQIEKNTHLFSALGLRPQRSGIALDLGAGSGFQSIPLARLGFKVKAVDLCGKLLQELRENAEDNDIEIIEGDIQNLRHLHSGQTELVLCMGDTLSHLEDRDAVRLLFDAAWAALEPGGLLVLSYRDLSRELKGADRFIPVRSDADRIFTCFLEYETDHVWVHDLVHLRGEGQWQLLKSRYRKLRLGQDDVQAGLTQSGFAIDDVQERGGFLTWVVRKPEA